MYQLLDQAKCEHRLIRWYSEGLPTIDRHRCDYGCCRHCLALIPASPTILPQQAKNGLLAKALIKNRAKDMARYEFHKAKRQGEIKQQPCAECGDPNSEAHHPDYSKPLDVVWLCRPHHTKADAYRRLAEKIQRYEKLLGLAVEA